MLAKTLLGEACRISVSLSPIVLSNTHTSLNDIHHIVAQFFTFLNDIHVDGTNGIGI